MLYETTAAIGQQSPPNYNLSQNNLDQSSLNFSNLKLESADKRTVTTSIKSNETQSQDSAPVLNVSRQDCWKMFDQLFSHTR